MSAPSRPTRKEQQARTRAALVRSATAAMADKGLQAASIAEIAAGVGLCEMLVKLKAAKARVGSLAHPGVRPTVGLAGPPTPSM